LRVGDVVKIEEHEELPADCILLSSSNLNGTAYLNTMSLDGETSLKEKIKSQSLEGFKGEEEISDFQTIFHVDLPNPSLVTWNANVETGNEAFPLSSKQLLLRGCKLKNTDWVLAIVIYTGIECKIVLNSKKTQTKTSELQKKMNRIVITILILLGSFSILFGGLGKSWYENNDADDYIDQPSSYRFPEFIIRALTYWIQLAALIPISLYVVIEIQRLILCSFINNDLKMYNKDIDRGATWRCSDIIEQMGKVEYIFSDKTGTLTKNEM
jgi:magnesium-transporting ATPase (P-type)